jgi:hypothetical protein
VTAAQPQVSLVPVIQPTGRTAKILSKGDGLTRDTAFRVRSVSEEYAILRTFGLEAGKQSLVVGKNGKAYDVLTATDPRSGATVELWFDVSSFFGQGF